MASKDLVFRLFGEDVNASASLRKLSRSAEESSRGIGRAFGELPKFAALATAGAAAASVKMAADFQQASTRLVTDAGEAAGHLAKVKEGMLGISSATGLGAKDTASAMYLVESAGYHGAAGLKVLQAVAEGSKIGMADSKTVADALTTTLTDYGKAAGGPAKAMSMLTATVSTGKTTMEALAGSLHSVMPAAAAAHISLAELLGAVGTMTAEGISADQATQNLNNSILSLQAPSQVATKAMAGIGVSALDVAKNLGHRGLAGTYNVLLGAMAKHSHAGMVVVNAFGQSAQAAASMNAMVKQMPAPLAAAAHQFAAGQLTSKEWAATLKGYPAITANLGKQFATTAKHATGFSDALKSGDGPTRTAAAQLEKMVGGQTGLSVAMHLTGEHMGAFLKNTKTIAGATTEAGGHVRGWADTQKGFNVQLAMAGATLQSVGIKIGTALLPPLTQAVKGFGGFFTALQKGNGSARTIAGIVAGIALAFTGLFVAVKTYEAVSRAAAMATAVFGYAQKTMAGETLIAKGAMLAWSAASKIAAAAQLAFNLIMDANPIALIVLAIVALIGIIILLVTHWKQVCAFLQTVWAGVCKWFADTLKVMGDNWNSSWKQIGAFLQAAWNGIVSWFRGAMAGYLGFWRDAWNTAVSLVTGIGKRITDFFAGAGKWLVDAGKHIIDGLVNGIRGAIGAVGDVIHGLADTVMSVFTGHVQIQSPSKVFYRYGQYIGQGLQLGLLGTKNQVAAASSSLAGAVVSMFEGGKISRATESAALGTIQRGTRQLEALAGQRLAVQKRLAAAEKTLTADRKTAKDYGSGIKSNVLQSGDVTQMGSAGDMVQRMSDLVAHTRTFRSVLKKLVSKGIDQATYSELVQAGVDGGGLTAAQSLLANPIDLKEVVSLQQQLSSAAGSLGADAAAHHYKSMLTNAQHAVSTLSARDRHYASEQKHVAAHVVNTAAHQVHIHIHGTIVGDKHTLAKHVHKAVVDAKRAGALPKNAFITS